MCVFFVNSSLPLSFLAPCAAQVLSMWEDTFTGVFKFRGRWLVHSSGLPKDAFARLQAARRTFADGADDGSTPAIVESKPPPPPQQQHTEDLEDEVLLTAKREDIDVRRIVKPITLSVATTSTQASPEPNGKSGPRLTHAFEETSGDFIPVERTDPVIKRARVRQEEAIARASRLAEEAAAAKSDKPVSQSSGWLLPKRKAPASCAAEGRSGGGLGRTVTATSVRDSESEGVSDSDSGPEEPPKSDDTEWERDDEEDGSDEDDSDSTDTDYQLLDAPPRKSARRRKNPVSRKGNAGGVGERKPSDDDLKQSPESTTPSAQAPPLGPHGHGHGPVRKRPRRLAVPAVEGEPSLSPQDDEDRASPSSCAGAASDPSATSKDDRPVRVRKASSGARGRTPSPATLSLLDPSTDPAARPRGRPSIAGKRKRGRPAKATAVEEAEESDFPPRHTLVGEDHQAEIPDLLSVKDRRKAAVPPPASTGAKLVSVPGGNTCNLLPMYPPCSRMGRWSFVRPDPWGSPPRSLLLAVPFDVEKGAACCLSTFGTSTFCPVLTTSRVFTGLCGTAGSNSETFFVQVWRSIRNWDPHSRQMLSAYLHAAKKVVQNKQSCPGVTVHVRLGGDTKNGGRPSNNSDSYAVWAVTTGRSRNSSGAVRVACSEMAQTEVPFFAIQRVQVGCATLKPEKQGCSGSNKWSWPFTFRESTLSPG